MRFADEIRHFARYMAEEQGLSPYSIRSHCAKTSTFLEWFGICGTLCDIGRATDRGRARSALAHPNSSGGACRPGALDSGGTEANLRSLALVGFEALKYYSERQNAHSQIGNTSGGSEKVVG